MHWALFGLQQTACAPGLLVPGMKMPEHCSPAAREHPCQWLRPSNSSLKQLQNADGSCESGLEQCHLGPMAWHDPAPTLAHLRQN